MFSKTLKAAFDSPAARLILLISEPSGFIASSANWALLPLETPLLERISIRPIWWSDVEMRQRLGRRAATEVIPEFKSAEVLSAPEQCVIATQTSQDPLPPNQIFQHTDRNSHLKGIRVHLGTGRIRHVLII